MRDGRHSPARPEWADCSYVDGSFAQHWRTLGAVVDESTQQKCLVDVVQYIDEQDLASTGSTLIRIGETTLRAAEVEHLIELARQGLTVIRDSAR